jgi:1-deoxy-D-xylulose-5-phosphate synthase
MSESRYDAFGGGHASVSISAAFGIAKAQELQQKPQHVVAVIGDGALTGGLAFEGLNNAGASPKTDILVVLNDNEMSIDKPAGALDSYLVRISTSRWYNTLKRTLWRGLSVIPPLHRLVRKTGNAIKHGLLQNSNLFESLNFRYFGPVDGHDIEELIRTLRGLKDIGGPKLLHIKTTKGKGYAPAEADPAVWHAPGRFDVATGKRVKFVQQNESLSKEGVVRGLHFQLPPHAQSKLVRVTQGEVVDVAVDIRRGSATFGKYVAVTLSAENHRQLFVPRGFAHGFVVRRGDAVVQYKCDNPYAPECEGSILWNDADLAIDWGISPESAILSAKDMLNRSLKECDELFDYSVDYYA